MALFVSEALRDVWDEPQPVRVEQLRKRREQRALGQRAQLLRPERTLRTLEDGADRARRIVTGRAEDPVGLCGVGVYRRRPTARERSSTSAIRPSRMDFVNVSAKAPWTSVAV